MACHARLPSSSNLISFLVSVAQSAPATAVSFTFKYWARSATGFPSLASKLRPDVRVVSPLAEAHLQPLSDTSHDPDRAAFFLHSKYFFLTCYIFELFIMFYCLAVLTSMSVP